VASCIAETKGNIIKLEHNQFVSTNRNSEVELRITMEAFGSDHKMQIVKTLENQGYKPRLVSAKLY
jgi:threonine dehydratase